MADAIRFHVADATDLWRLTVDPDRDPGLTAALVAAIGAPLPATHRPSTASGAGGPLLIWQGPHDMLIEGLGDRRMALGEVMAGRAALLGDAGAGLAVFDVRGQGLADHLAHDRPAAEGLASRVMRLADLRVTALWPDGGNATVRLFIDRSYADYFRAWLVERWQATDERGG